MPASRTLSLMLALFAAAATGDPVAARGCAQHASLQTALRAIVRKTGGYRADRDIDEVLKIGDAATGTQVLQDLYREMKSTAREPDLELLWHRLGVPQNPALQPFDDHAPLAAVRIAITGKP